MSDPGQPEYPMPPTPKPVDDIISAPDVVRALENDECCFVLDHIPIALAVARRSGEQQKICYSNNAFQSLTGLHATELEGNTWTILDPFVDEDHATVTLARALAEREDFLGTFRNHHADHAPLVVQAYSNRIENDDGTENYLILALVDVTDQENLQRESYEQQIRDKDLLLKELQHRVK